MVPTVKSFETMISFPHNVSEKMHSMFTWMNKTIWWVDVNPNEPSFPERILLHLQVDVKLGGYNYLFAPLW